MRLGLARRGRVLAFAVVAGIGIGGVAYASIPDGGGIIHGCYAKKDGLLRVVDTDAAAACNTKETPLNWNEQGPKGDTGPIGPAGPKGDAGATGDPGESGVSGLHTVSFLSPLDSSGLKLQSGPCPVGERIVGGGTAILYDGAGALTVVIDISYPSSDTTWLARAYEMTPTDANWRIAVRVMCAAVAG